MFFTSLRVRTNRLLNMFALFDTFPWLSYKQLAFFSLLFCAIEHFPHCQHQICACQKHQIQQGEVILIQICPVEGREMNFLVLRSLLLFDQLLERIHLRIAMLLDICILQSSVVNHCRIFFLLCSQWNIFELPCLSNRFLKSISVLQKCKVGAWKLKICSGIW